MTRDSRRVSITKRIEERTREAVAELDRRAREQLELLRTSSLEDEFEPEATIDRLIWQEGEQ